LGPVWVGWALGWEVFWELNLFFGKAWVACRGCGGDGDLDWGVGGVWGVFDGRATVVRSGFDCVLIAAVAYVAIVVGVLGRRGLFFEISRHSYVVEEVRVVWVDFFLE
jgi:hypothetical protein